MRPPLGVRVTPVSRLVLAEQPEGGGPARPLSGKTGAHALAVVDHVLGGGVLTFVGDSVSSQAFYSLLTLARTSARYAVTAPVVPVSDLGTSAVSVVRKPSLEHAFTLELFRADRASEFDRMVNRALTIAPVRYPRGASKAKAAGVPRHVVAVNVGLHFSSRRASDFESQVRALASRMRLLNLLSGHFAFFRDVTPQHFKPRNGSLPSAVFGGYEKRDKSATECVPLSGKFAVSNGADFNAILRGVAAEIGVPVQTTQPLLRGRHDAHIGGRKKATHGGFVLDCTHWCASALDVFDVTLVDVLEARFGKAGAC